MWPLTKQEWQLVIELLDDSPEAFEKTMALQDEMDATLISGQLDGNDVGSGVINIFIITESPNQCLAEAFTYIEKHGIRPNAAGARKLNSEDYVRLWPKGDPTPFNLK